MAAAAPSPLASSVEKTNGAKLSRLLIDGGTTVLRNVFDSYHPPANLAADLNANYLTLDNLLKKRVLRAAQWDKLFPPGGATPDSKTFDITLLFLLLTNICGGLTPPLSGWHSKPPPSDSTPEANLARIKFFRNELYGHVSTTSVDSSTFTSLWKEISTVLVDLGLSQAEIDRLKAEHCGEEDYLGVLRDWADSEEDIKSHLKDIRQYQTETKQDVDKIRQSQIEDRKTLKDTKSKLKEVHQIQIKTQQNVERISQTQLEDRRSLQDNKSKLEEVHQLQTKTQETVEAVETGLQAIKQVVGSLTEEKKRENEADKVLRNLAKSEFKGDIEYHLERFQEGTRVWVFNKVQYLLDDRNSPNRAMVISANAGMGKSVISALICKKMQEVGRLSGSHFCQHNNARYRNPQLMLQSLAHHLCHVLPEYKQALVEQLSRNLGKDLNNMGVEELFGLLFKEPLSSVADPGRNMLMVIDGLDESEYQERNELLDVIANHFCKLPGWIRFLCTTRPERNIAEALKHLKPFQLESNDEENVKDIRLFFEKRIQNLMKPENEGRVVKKLVEKSEGLMLYAYFLVLFIKENVSVLGHWNLDSSLPLAISSVYHSYFKRLENELIKELGVKEENFLNLLCAVTASREPLPVDYVSKVLVPSENVPVARRKVLKAIGSVSSLLPIHDGSVHVIHKSVKDWLTDRSCYAEHDFAVDEKEGHCILASLCSDELDNLKQKGIHNTQFSPTEKYSLKHGVRHMLQLEEYVRPGGWNLEQCVQSYVIDLELLYAKLCEDISMVAEELLWLQGQEITLRLSADSKSLVNTLFFLLRKHFSTFSDHPHIFFQAVLNEGGSVLSPVASNLLQNKYTEISYIEFVQKHMQQKAVQTRFQCSSKVACLDVSRQLDYMVCECKSGTIQLWSLHTGRLEWERPAKVTKHYRRGFGAYRILPSSPGVLSFYRSVAFHPTADVVLPGVLSHAFTFDGDLNPLFPESKCSFTVCSISEDKTAMLTDYPDDAKCIIMWSLENGSEIARTTRNEDVLSFAAMSRDGKLLAISNSGGSISIVDAKNSFSTLAQAATPGVCGMIKFTPDRRFLFCWHNTVRLDDDLFCLNVEIGNHDTCSLSAAIEDAPNDPRECVSISKGGFLLGDPFSSLFQTAADGFELLELAFGLVFNKQIVIRGHPRFRYVELLNVDEIPEDAAIELPTIGNMAFSFNGDTIYGVSDYYSPTVMAWNVSAGKTKAEKGLETVDKSFVPVKDGVLLISESHSLEQWNFDLTECVRSVTDLPGITQLISISEELVACVKENEVFILDTATGKIFKQMPTFNRQCIACNSKYHMLTATSRTIGVRALCFDDVDNDDLTTVNFLSIELLDGKGSPLWQQHFPGVWFYYSLGGMFSPTEKVTIISANTHTEEQDLYFLDASTGSTIRTIHKNIRSDCKFASDESCVMISFDSVKGKCLQLFNVKSGDLLSEISVEPAGGSCLAVCLPRNLIAISSQLHRSDFKLFHLHLPRDKDNKESKGEMSTNRSKNFYT